MQQSQENFQHTSIAGNQQEEQNLQKRYEELLDSSSKKIALINDVRIPMVEQKLAQRNLFKLSEQNMLDLQKNVREIEQEITKSESLVENIHKKLEFLITAVDELSIFKERRKSQLKIAQKQKELLEYQQKKAKSLQELRESMAALKNQNNQ